MNIPEKIARLLSRATLASLAVPLSFGLITSAIASPSDDLTRAVSRGGSASVEEASASQFLRAFTAVLVRARPKEVVWYVNAAVKLRPDLADRIVVAALNVIISGADLSDRQNKQKIAAEITDIIQAAIAADPDAAVAIVKAAVTAAPFARDWIVAAAIAAAPDQRIAFLQAAHEGESNAFFWSSRVGAGNISSTTFASINPANLSGNGNVNSPEQPPSGP